MKSYIRFLLLIIYIVANVCLGDSSSDSASSDVPSTVYVVGNGAMDWKYQIIPFSLDPNNPLVGEHQFISNYNGTYLASIIDIPSSNDMVIFYYSGHGKYILANVDIATARSDPIPGMIVEGPPHFKAQFQDQQWFFDKDLQSIINVGYYGSDSINVTLFFWNLTTNTLNPWISQFFTDFSSIYGTYDHVNKIYYAVIFGRQGNYVDVIQFNINNHTSEIYKGFHNQVISGSDEINIFISGNGKLFILDDAYQQQLTLFEVNLSNRTLDVVLQIENHKEGFGISQGYTSNPNYLLFVSNPVSNDTIVFTSFNTDTYESTQVSYDYVLPFTFYMYGN